MREIKEIPEMKITICTEHKECGCDIFYTYPNCTNQDLIKGGCIESCKCLKYEIKMDKCDKHK